MVDEARSGSTELDLSVSAAEFAVDGCHSTLAQSDLFGEVDYGGETESVVEGVVVGGVGIGLGSRAVLSHSDSVGGGASEAGSTDVSAAE